jgi:hypothetical protein
MTYPLVGYTIYEHPPGYVVRAWCRYAGDARLLWPFVVPSAVGPEIQRSAYVCLCQSLDDARAPFLDRHVRIPREPDDDPVIVETWM